jgi:hypothetical protein
MKLSKFMSLILYKDVYSYSNPISVFSNKIKTTSTATTATAATKVRNEKKKILI